MATLNILLYSTQRTQRLRYEDSDGIMTTEIENTFLRCNCDGHYGPEWTRIEVCPETRTALKALEAKYDTATGLHIRKLHGFIAKLKDGEFFYYINEDATNVVARRTAIDCLKAAKAGVKAHKQMHNVAFGHYSRLNIFFEYFSYGYDGLEEWIGCPDAEKRVCRFCERSMPDTTFEKDAHAVQDALGNKLLFCYDECDECNNDLAPIEDNFRKLMDFRRAMYHIPRKETTKTAKIVGENYIILPDEKGYPLLYIMEEELPNIDITKPFMYRFNHKGTMTNERMYKALCKMVIDMLPSKELPHFKNTIKWIKSDSDMLPDSLPSAWYTVLPVDEPVFKQPVLDIMINNRGMLSHSPYCTAILWIYDIAYMFIMPLVDIDTGMYKYDKDLVEHWNVVKQLICINNWERQDTSDYNPSFAWCDWDVDTSLPNVFVLPKSNHVFAECLIEKSENPDCGLPQYLNAGLSLASINNVDFISLYNGTITDTELRDITQHIAGPEFILYPQEKRVRVRMWVDANDTTDSIEYFKFHLDITVNVSDFDKYVDIKYKDEGYTFALHYGLRNHLYIMALAAAEHKMKSLRSGTPFVKCSLKKMIEARQIFKYAYYLLPTEEDCNYYYKIDDSKIHNNADLCDMQYGC